MSALVPASDVAKARIRRFEAAGLEPWRCEMLEHPDGVFIHLPEMDYLNDWALSYTAFKLLNSNPPDWWWNTTFNTLVDKAIRKSTPALRFGAALHALMLEGREALDARFFVPPDPKDPRWKDYARLNDQIKAKIVALGEKPDSKNADGTAPAKKDDWIKQLLELDPKAKLFDKLVDDWRGDGRVELTQDQYTHLLLMEHLAAVHPDLSKAFSGIGFSEVSCFWTSSEEDDEGPGIRQRMRIDRAKPKSTIDLKSFSNWKDREFIEAMLREATLRKYHVQTAHYDVGRKKARQLIAEGKVYFCEEVVLTQDELDTINAQRLNEDDHLELGAKRTIFRDATPEEMETVNAVFMAHDEWAWIWMFYKTDGAPTAQAIRCNRDTLPMREGEKARAEALQHFRHYNDLFGLQPGEMWLRMDKMLTPDDSQWPRFMSTEIA